MAQQCLSCNIAVDKSVPLEVYRKKKRNTNVSAWAGPVVRRDKAVDRTEALALSPSLPPHHQLSPPSLRDGSELRTHTHQGDYVTQCTRSPSCFDTRCDWVEAGPITVCMDFLRLHFVSVGRCVTHVSSQNNVLKKPQHQKDTVCWLQQ